MTGFQRPNAEGAAWAGGPGGVPMAGRMGDVWGDTYPWVASVGALLGAGGLHTTPLDAATCADPSPASAACS
jgi:hypothetical protein